jgi:hypothetical protein
MQCQLVMVIVFQLEDRNASFSWTERHEYNFHSRSAAQVQFHLLEARFRQDNPETFKTAFAIYVPIKD